MLLSFIRDAGAALIHGGRAYWLGLLAVLAAMLFVIVAIGRPDRLLHMLPVIGRLNFPQSMLAWDVVVLSGCLLLNLTYLFTYTTAITGNASQTSPHIFPLWSLRCSRRSPFTR